MYFQAAWHCDSEPANIISREPFQPRDITFPISAKGNRKFQVNWFDEYKWLEWGTEANAAFCHPCRQIALSDSSRITKSSNAFTTVGFSNWKKACEAFKDHEKSHAHRLSIVKFGAIIKGENVFVKVNDQYAAERKVATECLYRICTTLRYLCRQGLALRGHTDGESNFRQLLKLRSDDSQDLQHWLQRKTKWTSVDIQEEIVTLMAHELVRTFSTEVRERKCFAIIADETADISRIEQLSICLRTVTLTENKFEVQEKLFGFYAMDVCDGESLFLAIRDSLIRLDIDMKDCRAMTFDGASPFSSQSVGVGSRIRSISPSSLHTHCQMHCLNLSVQDVVKNVPIMRDFLQFVGDLINFVRDSPKRCAIVRNAAETLNNPQTHIRPLCPTRFTCKYNALSGLQKQLLVIIEALEIIESEASDKSISSKASGFLRRLGDFDTIFALQVALPIFELTDRLSRQLQGLSVSVGEGLELVRHAIAELRLMRSDESFEAVWQEAELQRTEMGASEPKLPRQVRAPRRLQENQSHVFLTPKAFFAAKYFEVVDMASERLNERLCNKDMRVLTAIELLLHSGWQGVKSVDFDDALQTVVKHYGCDLDAPRLAAQLMSLELLHENELNDEVCSKTSISEIIQAVAGSNVNKMLPQVTKMIQLYLVCPATSATAERSFSELRRLKTYLRSTMGQRRLNALAILSTYPDELDKLDMDSILRQFVCRSEMRRNAFNYSL